MPTETSGKQEKELPMISKEALTSFQENKQKIIKETVNRSLKRQEEVEHHGQKAREILIAGLGFMTQNLEVAMTLGEVTFLHDQLNWARDRLPHDGVSMEHLLSRFQIYRDLVKETMSRQHSHEVIKYIDWMIEQQQKNIEK
jgi:hypothetical protein